MQLNTFTRRCPAVLGVTATLLTAPAVAKGFVFLGGSGPDGTVNNIASGVGSLLTETMGDVNFTVEGSAG